MSIISKLSHLYTFSHSSQTPAALFKTRIKTVMQLKLIFTTSHTVASAGLQVASAGLQVASAAVVLACDALKLSSYLFRLCLYLLTCFLFRFMRIISDQRRWNDPTTHNKADYREIWETKDHVELYKCSFSVFLFCMLYIWIHAYSIHTHPLCAYKVIYYFTHSILILLHYLYCLTFVYRHCMLLVIVAFCIFININVFFTYLYVHNSCLFWPSLLLLFLAVCFVH